MKARFIVLFSALVGLLSVGRADTLTVGLVTHYEFNGDIADSSGNGFDLTAQGGIFNYVTDATGNAGGAVQLVDDANIGFFIGTGPNLANQSSSVSFWVRKDYTGNGSNGSWVFGLGHPSGTGGSLGEDMHVALDYGQSLRYSFFHDDFNSNTPLSNFAWNHLAFTFDYATSLRSIYINGVLDSTNTAAFPFTGGNSLKMGYEGLSLDDFRLYNRALNADEVATLARVPETGMTALYLGVGLLGLAARRRFAAVP